MSARVTLVELCSLVLVATVMALLAVVVLTDPQPPHLVCENGYFLDPRGGVDYLSCL